MPSFRSKLLVTMSEHVAHHSISGMGFGIMGCLVCDQAAPFPSLSRHAQVGRKGFVEGAVVIEKGTGQGGEVRGIGTIGVTAQLARCAVWKPSMASFDKRTCHVIVNTVPVCLAWWYDQGNTVSGIWLEDSSCTIHYRRQI